ncbi:hypothetical protein SAMN05421504_103802 [Amycolatopsis xylanica]|uniref:Uncharacterized protein n=1 Tax=Amycolatopsis xylanica TaxID=589385 RepID=A0A1H3EFN5_9PSEU|nr:hypothetical protein [Amycolatopsis xylanica]SDX77526.1 hypothetical protein SAMN05421504_103802 [Amycolatopsis xylanica]
MKKVAGIVAATAIGLSVFGGTALAAPAGEPAAATHSDDWPSFGDAASWFMDGGGALGYGAAAVVAGAYTGIATTPALILHSLSKH